MQAVGEELGDELTGADVVHYDWHPGNVLVEPAAPDRVVAVVDWAGAWAGHVAEDLASLVFACALHAPELAPRAERALLDLADERSLRLAWAHMALRLADWSIRHHPDNTDRVLAIANRHL